MHTIWIYNWLLAQLDVYLRVTQTHTYIQYTPFRHIIPRNRICIHLHVHSIHSYCRDIGIYKHIIHIRILCTRVSWLPAAIPSFGFKLIPIQRWLFHLIMNPSSFDWFICITFREFHYRLTVWVFRKNNSYHAWIFIFIHRELCVLL